MKVTVCIHVVLVCIWIVIEAAVENEKKASYWIQEGRKALLQRINQQKQLFGNVASFQRKAKNVIIFVGDGMGLSTVTAARIYAAQRKNASIPESFSFERFPYVSFAKTHTVDYQVTDSAQAATSLVTGIKGNRDTAGLSAEVQVNDCDASLKENSRPTTLLQWAQNEGLATGFITNTRVTHGTPSALYAHVPSRDWEFSAPSDCQDQDIASQMINNNPGKGLNLIMGGGRSRFLPTALRGARTDGKNLLEKWQKDRANSAVISTKQQLDDPKLLDKDYVLGLFDWNHLPYEVDRSESQPSLSHLVKKAVLFMNKFPKGFLLFVEGGKIDLAHHKNWGLKALEETQQLNEAVKEALSETSSDDTLILVTADHSHSLTINGDPMRDNDILGLAGVDDDNLTFTTLLYSNGPGHLEEGRTNLTLDEVTQANYTQQAAVPVKGISYHGAEDVPVYASGPGANIFSGVYDQTFIAHAISYASCIGHHKDLCRYSNGSFLVLPSSPFLLLYVFSFQTLFLVLFRA